MSKWVGIKKRKKKVSATNPQDSNIIKLPEFYATFKLDLLILFKI